MTLKEGIAEIAAITSNRTIIANKQEHYSSMTGVLIDPAYSMSVLPGVDGSEITQIYGSSIDSCVRQMRDKINPTVTPSTPNEE